MYLYLKQAIARLPKRTRLLHIAPEKNLSPFLRSQANLEYLSADIDPKTAMLQMDITKIKFPDYSFDVIVCSHVLEHVREERRAMAEFYRVLRPGGWAMLQVPYSPVLESTYEDDSIVSASERTVRCGQEDHVRIYGLDHVTRLQNAGFEVETYSYAAEFGRQAAQRYGLILNELLFIAHKREA
jgi:predicted SAM-dependent methyltransferase